LFQAAGDDDCYACHAPDYEQQHQGSGFPTTCTTCHGTDSWDASGSFDHSVASGGFDLVGAHSVAACETCHATPGFEPLFQAAGDDDCYACHAPDYELQHQGSGFPTTCTTCHGTDSWDASGSFDHSAASGGFDLVGAHSVAACETCHATPGFEPLFQAAGDGDCYACHAPDYELQHQGSGFPTTCTTCHGTDSWDASGSFDHAAASGGFDLVGAHTVAACESCHATPGFEPLFQAAGDDDCYACHAPDYELQHQGSGFPTTCTTCHGTDSWDASGSFDHSAASGGFDLVGAHTVAACESCHATPGFEPLFQAAGDDDCYACHAPDYNQEHSGTGFPTTCETCHSTNTWTGARFDNHDTDYFPIYSGRHNGLWSTCQTCHENPGDFQVFTCLTCHEHRQSKMDDVHSGTNGYAWDSVLCLNCHPQGRN
jgi:hypothetical protein